MSIDSATGESFATPPAGDAADVRCPLCDYDLRGQIEPRCPECGYRFDWNELRDPARRKHPYLFEHHPERNLWSFFATLAGGWRPGRFWKEIFPTQPSRPRRLLIYFLIVALISLLPMAGNIALGVEQQIQGFRNFPQMMSGAQWARLSRKYPGLTHQQISNLIAPTPSFMQVLGQTYGRAMVPLTVAALEPVLWALLTMAAMMVFRISMQRARVRPIHMWRCIVYSADCLFWASVLLLLEVGMQWIVSPPPGSAINSDFMLAWTVVMALAWWTFVVRLRAALRFYLRFDHAFLSVLATQVIAFLALCVILVNVG